MAIVPLTLAEVCQVYHERIVRDFPADERKPLARIKAALRRDAYRCLGLKEGDRLLAYAFFVLLRREGS